MRNLRQIRGSVHVAFVRGRRLDLVRDAVESRGERRGECEIWIRVRAGGAAFDAQRRSVADDAESRGAIVVAPRDSRLRERARDVAFVRRRVRRIEREELAEVRHPAAEEVAEDRSLAASVAANARYGFAAT